MTSKQAASADLLTGQTNETSASESTTVTLSTPHTSTPDTKSSQMTSKQAGMILIKENKTWEDALNYCRVNHTDLVSITSAEVKTSVNSLAVNASTPYVWLGLRYSCTLGLWFWVNDQIMCFNWASTGTTMNSDMFGAMDTSREHNYKGFNHSKTKRFNFICST
ncbi:C-type lectin lectoxin-Lio3-like isoform X1 [Oreochromis niloticus]|uniref:C-type lectin lectoxin-Lio3-like isoform X1 n=1 Tax=Oreochromis niloticus TaxID=8128 RepID=UPI000904A0BB|nr:C-type lectin lectoxin-Lio3-like isoform X1 [Oreochromis niloticus]